MGPAALPVPVVGLGSWQMEVDDRETAMRTIRRAIDLGMTHVDTAEIYGSGTVEDLVGEAIAGYRSEVFLTSKVHPDHATFAGTLLACEKSLRRLRTDRLDLYLLHWRGAQPLEETFRAFEALREEGKIRAWGVSNFDVADIEDAVAIAGEDRITCNQVLYNLHERDAEHVLFPVCERHRISIVAYSPLGSGHFPGAGTWRGDVLWSIARAHRVSSRAVALAFLARRPGTFVIPKTSNVEHLEELALAATVTLGAAEIETLESAFPLGPPKSRMPQL